MQSKYIIILLKFNLLIHISLSPLFWLPKYKICTNFSIKGDLQTIFRFSYLDVYKLITMGMKFKNL